MKRKMSLRSRITLSSILVMGFSSVLLLVLMNSYIGSRLPLLTKNFIGSVESIQSDTSIKGNDASGTPDYSIGQKTTLTLSEVQAIVRKASNELLYSSFLLLIMTITVGGISAYVISGRTLSPLRKLNENVHRAGTANESPKLAVEGPRDEVRELTVSFNAMLAKLNNAVLSQKRFNASVAHELKTPLAIIKANIDVLNDQDEKTIDDYQNTLKIVELTVRKMNALVDTLLDTIQQESANLDDSVHVDEVLNDVADDLSLLAAKKKITLNCETKPVTPIMGNNVLLYRAFYNIIENAIKYNKEGGEVQINCVEKKAMIIIQVKDTGKGIAQKDQEKIFEPFYRVKEKNNEEGFGLGLSLAKSVIDISGGTISVNSTLNVGSEFEIQLPVYDKS